MKWWGWVLVGLAAGAAISWVAALARDEKAIAEDATRRAAAMVADSIAAHRQALLDSAKIAALSDAALRLAELARSDSVVVRLRSLVGTLVGQGQALRDQLAASVSASDSVPLLVGALGRADEVVAGQAVVIDTLRASVVGWQGVARDYAAAAAFADSSRGEAEERAVRWRGVADSAIKLVGRPERKKWLGLIPAPTLEYGPLVCVGCGGKPVTYGGGVMLVFRR